MSATIQINAKIFGKNKPILEDWCVSLPENFPNSSLTLKDLLTHIVLAEVTAFQERQEQRRLIRILTPAEISQGVAQGKIDPGGNEIGQSVDTERMVANALQAFQDGFYYVFIDENQQENLESQVFLQPNSQILFLRLTPLIGG